MSLTHRRRRMASLATAATLVLGLPAAGPLLSSGPARAADPVADCVQPFPVAELEAGDQVDGLTVERGTTPTTFTGEVLGVVEDGIGPDVPMVMVELAMPAFARTGGVWQGMSGSPVYADDGRLIGAVAYGLSFGPSAIAGITPFEDMDDYLAVPPARRVALGKAAARTVAARAGITSGQAARGFLELPMPMGVTGVTPRLLAKSLAKAPRFLGKSSYVLGRASAAAAGPETMLAGGNLGVSVAYGDIAMAGVGTVTSVCEGRIVGFGHPMAMLGSTTMGLHPADAVYVQPESLGSPFKVANLAPVAGTVTDDRLTGVSGTIGPLPATSAVTSTVTYGARSRTGSTAVSVPDFAAEATFYQLAANQDRVVDGQAKGSELLSWRITGTENGRPFTLGFTDRWTGYDLSYDTAGSVAEMVYHLGSLDGVRIASVQAQASVTDDLRRHTIRFVEQRRAGAWVRVTRRAPAIARAGKTVRLRVVLGGRAGKRVVPLRPVTLPKKARGPVMLVAVGGDEAGSYLSGSTVGKVRTELAKQLRHDQIRVQVGTANKVDFGFGEEEYEMFRARPASFVRTRTSAPQTHVVGGTKMLTVLVR